MSYVPKADDIRREVRELMSILVDLADYTREELIEIVDEAMDKP